MGGRFPVPAERPRLPLEPRNDSKDDLRNPRPIHGEGTIHATTLVRVIVAKKASKRRELEKDMDMGTPPNRTLREP